MKIWFVALSCLYISACVTKVENASNIHSKEVSQWQDLAAFSGNELVNLGFTITANIRIDNSKDGDNLYITDIKLTSIKSNKELDLLSPSFAMRFVCGSECYRLSQLKQIEGVPQTKVAQFFEENEGAFFRFYGKLSQLNKTIMLFRETNSKELKKYLKRLITINTKYDSLELFLAEFEELLNEDEWAYFIENDRVNLYTESKYKLITNNLNDLPVNNESILDLPIDNDETTGAITTPNSHWKSFNKSGVIDEENFTGDELLVAQLISEQERKLAYNYENSQVWKASKEKNVMVGDVVCTFSDSRFGVVALIKDSVAKVSIVGQAIVILDGVNFEAPKGFLFSDQEEFYFQEQQVNKDYAISDLASCDIAHLREGEVLDNE